MRPLILITNDDGVLSPGLRVAEAVSNLGELLIAAPIRQQTGMARSFPYMEDTGIIKETPLEMTDRFVYDMRRSVIFNPKRKMNRPGSMNNPGLAFRARLKIAFRRIFFTICGNEFSNTPWKLFYEKISKILYNYRVSSRLIYPGLSASATTSLA